MKKLVAPGMTWMARLLVGATILFQATSRASAALTESEAFGKMPPAADLLGVQISADGQHVVMAVRDADHGAALWLDGERKADVNADVRGLALSPDGRHFAYATKDANGWTVVADGRRHKTYDAIGGFSESGTTYAKLTYSPDGQRLAYIASKGEERMVVLDGTEQKHFRAVSDFLFSEDGQHWACEASEVGRTGPFMVVVDGKESVHRGGAQNLIFRPGTDELAYGRVDFDGFSVAIDKKEFGPFSFMYCGPVFSDDGKRHAFSVKMNKPDLPGDSILFVDETPQKIAPDPPSETSPVSSIIFSPNGKRVAYVRLDALGEPHDVIEGRYTTHVVPYMSTVVVDGVKQPRFESVKRLVFSPDSSHLAYATKTANKWRMMKNALQGPEFDNIVTAAVFSPDSKKIAYAAWKGGQCRMVIDDQPILEYELIVPQTKTTDPNVDHWPLFTFQRDGTLPFIAKKDDRLFRVRVRPE